MKDKRIAQWRLPLLIAAAAGLAVLVAVSGEGGQLSPVDATVRPVQKVKTALAPAYQSEPAKSDEALIGLLPRQFDGEVSEIFRVVAPAAPPPVVKVAEGPPGVPPLPFKFVGMMVDDDRVSALISLQGKDITVQAGDDIDANYRVEKISSREIQFIYLPLKAEQILSIGEKN